MELALNRAEWMGFQLAMLNLQVLLLTGGLVCQLTYNMAVIKCVLYCSFITSVATLRP
jgi:hypothetical protein